MDQHITKDNIHNLMNELEEKYKNKKLNPNKFMLT